MIMARQDKNNKTNKNGKKEATKPAKTAGQPVLPKYARNDSAVAPLDLSLQAKKGRK